MNRIFALGFFDGVHLGHQALLAECRRLAAENNCETAAITFETHPQSPFTKNPPRQINTLQDRNMLLLRYGIDRVYAFPATEDVMSTEWEAFLELLLTYGGAGFVCGEDFRFGRGGEGNVEKLRQFCRERQLPCSIVPEQLLDGMRIASTHIRSLLEEGNMAEANRFLGHPHVLSGEVTTGRKLGRTLGIPTANLLIPEGVVCPKHGVYACKAVVEGTEYLAVTNVGNRPTVGGHRVTVEPWLLDFDGDLYGKHLLLEFHSFLRAEKKFDSLEILKAEIQENARQTRKFFEKT